MYRGRDLFHPSLDPLTGHFQYEPSYELLRAARWRGLAWQHFNDLASDDQALIIAEYRIEMRYLAVDSWANRPGQPQRKRKR